jgi:segregation and condensation protein B
MEETQPPAVEAVTPEELLPTPPEAAPEQSAPTEIVRLTAIIEAIVYLTDQPLTVEQIAGALKQDPATVASILKELTAEFDQPEHGVAIREVAGGFSMATKPEHHDEVRAFVKNMTPPMKLSLPSLETLSVIAYRQPITAPEIMEIRGVQGAGVLKTLLDRKLIAAAGRKNVIGKPILYKTTREFLVQFGLKDLNELPSLKEFEEIRRLSVPEEPASETLPFTESEAPPEAEVPPASETPAVPQTPLEEVSEEGSKDNGS